MRIRGLVPQEDGSECTASLLRLVRGVVQIGGNENLKMETWKLAAMAGNGLCHYSVPTSTVRKGEGKTRIDTLNAIVSSSDNLAVLLSKIRYSCPAAPSSKKNVIFVQYGR
jgi:hypothetical protein